MLIPSTVTKSLNPYLLFGVITSLDQICNRFQEPKLLPTSPERLQYRET